MCSPLAQPRRGLLLEPALRMLVHESPILLVRIRQDRAHDGERQETHDHDRLNARLEVVTRFTETEVEVKVMVVGAKSEVRW